PNPAPPAPGPQSLAPTITIDDFAKVDMRVGEVLSAEPIPGAKKLLKLMVDIGAEVRQVCAGIAEYYQPEQLVGMKVVLVTNLQRARAARVKYLLTIGGAGGPDRLGEAVRIAERHEWIYAAAGVHPHEAAKARDSHFDELRELAAHPQFVAIGEIGLDYYYDH